MFFLLVEESWIAPNAPVESVVHATQRDNVPVCSLFQDDQSNQPCLESRHLAESNTVHVLNEYL